MFNRFLLAIDHISKGVYGLYKVVPPPVMFVGL